MNGKRATIAIVPRERFSHAEQTVRSILNNTKIPYDLVYVDGKTPEPIRSRVLKELEPTNPTIITSESYLSPNEARNMAANAAKTEFVVFLDNDTLVGPRWLEEMIACAEATGAAQVGPLQFIGQFTQQTIHIAGGFFHEVDEQGRKVLYDEQRLFEAKLKTIMEPLRRLPCDYIEFHCMLLKRDVLEHIGGLDEHMRNVHEHIDLALELRRRNQKIFFEPKALATYIPPQNVAWFDLPYFEIRWCEEWAIPSVNHFRQKWGYDRMGYLGETDSANMVDDTIVKFVRGHRGSVVGNQVSAKGIDASSDLTQGELELMVSAFLTVERNLFDLVETHVEHKTSSNLKNLTAEEIFRRIDSRRMDFMQGQASLAFSPAPNPHTRVPCLILLRDLSEVDRDSLLNHAFLTLKKYDNTYDCWFAISLPAGNTPSRVRQFAEKVGACNTTPRPSHEICVNRLNRNSHRLHLLNAGQIMTEVAFSKLALGQLSTSMVFPDLVID